MGRVLFLSARPIAVASWNRRLPRPQKRRLAIQEELSLHLSLLLIILILLWTMPLKLRGLGGDLEGPPPPVRTK